MKFISRLDLLLVLFFFVVSLFTLKDLFSGIYYTSHDGIHQVVRLYYFDRAIRDGQIPPRWAAGLLNGYGYPLFTFSYHLPWFIAEPFYLLGLSIFDSIKITFIIGFFLSAVTMYFFQKEVFTRSGAFIGTIIYLFAPFRFSNIFVRGAIGDATIFIFPPLLFWALNKLTFGNKLNFMRINIASITIAAMILTHAMVAVLYFLFIFLFVLYKIIISHHKKLQIFAITLIFLFAFGLASYYLIPSFIERNLTRFEEIMRPTYFGQNYLKLSDLFYSPWGYGTFKAKEGAMSLQLGIAQWIVAILGMTTVFICIFQRKLRYRNYLGIFFSFIFVISIFMMLPSSHQIWILINRVAFVDFPWRILSVTVFSTAVLSGFFLSSFKNKKIVFVVAILLLTLSFYSNRNHLRINQTLIWPLDFYLKLEKTTNSYDEYIPKWANFDHNKASICPIEFNSSEYSVDIKKKQSNKLIFTINSKNSGIVRINTLYYPGWQVFVNGRPKDIKYDSGLIEFKVESGVSEVEALFKETLLRRISNLISFTAIFILLIIFTRWKKLKFRLP